MARVTAKDVAREAAVDPSTVSRVLNRSSDRHTYDASTVDRIRKAAQRLDYVPSRMAQALRTGKTLLLGLLVSDIASPFFAELAAHIERRVRAHSYRLMICNTDEEPSLQAEHVRELVSRGVDGLIVSPSGDKGLNDAVAAGVTVVTIDRRLPSLRVPHIGLDDVLAGRLLGEHLRELGYGCVGLVAPATEHDSSIDLRLEGLRQGLGRRGEIAWMVRTPHLVSPQEAASAMRRELCASLPEAIVGLNLASNLAALEAIGQERLQVPEQIGLAGIDDFTVAPYLRAPLTVVAQPVDAIASRVVATLLALAQKKKVAPLQLLPPSLIQRASLRRLN